MVEAKKKLHIRIFFDGFNGASVIFYFYVLDNQCTNDNTGVNALSAHCCAKVLSINQRKLIPIKEFCHFYPSIIRVQFTFKFRFEIKNIQLVLWYIIEHKCKLLAIKIRNSLHLSK